MLRFGLGKTKMVPATRTPEGDLNHCPICGHTIRIEASRPPGDAPCPHCGTLLWFVDRVPTEATNNSGLPLPQIVTAWEFGVQAIRRGEVDTGLEVLQNVVAHRPNDLPQRKALRAIERELRKRESADEAAATTVPTDIWWEIRQAKHKRSDQFIEWDMIDRAVERGLAVAPWDVELNLELGDACRARGYRDIARYAYECAIKLASDREDIKVRLQELDP